MHELRRIAVLCVLLAAVTAATGTTRLRAGETCSKVKCRGLNGFVFHFQWNGWGPRGAKKSLSEVDGSDAMRAFTKATPMIEGGRMDAPDWVGRTVCEEDYKVFIWPNNHVKHNWSPSFQNAGKRPATVKCFRKSESVIQMMGVSSSTCYCVVTAKLPAAGGGTPSQTGDAAAKSVERTGSIEVTNSVGWSNIHVFK